MKKIALLLLLCMLLCPLSAFASNDVAVQINGKLQVFDVPAQIINDRTMVPMRHIFETYGGTVSWIPTSQTIVSTWPDGTIIRMSIGHTVMNVTNVISGKNETIMLDSPPVIVPGDRTLVPVRAISESLGKNVVWDDLTRTVFITG